MIFGLRFTAALNIVSEVANHVNESMKQGVSISISSCVKLRFGRSGGRAVKHCF